MKLLKIRRRVKDVSSLISVYDRLLYNYHNRGFLVPIISFEAYSDIALTLFQIRLKLTIGNSDYLQQFIDYYGPIHFDT